jgi:hypothetical protein
MKPASNYPYRLRWLVPDKTKNSTTGQMGITHIPNGYLWCNILETNGRVTEEGGAVQKGADCEITIRGYPTVTGEDLLKDVGTGVVYRIDSVRVGSWEMIADAHTNENLVDYDLDEGS